MYSHIDPFLMLAPRQCWGAELKQWVNKNLAVVSERAHGGIPTNARQSA